ncbi:hypothetical protein POTOM_044177 [Populus tomentosa]|uniref:Uncharacterized protein n=1 Tax=Populus tomentosa TaxID=118781 RepID=A0A8X7YLU0_POPTO|nr:hypothetical protein POTOM_044177 [Populus tomentosa]
MKDAVISTGGEMLIDAGEGYIEGRMDLESTDYPGTGANNHHDPKTPGKGIQTSVPPTLALVVFRNVPFHRKAARALSSFLILKYGRMNKVGGLVAEIPIVVGLCPVFGRPLLTGGDMRWFVGGDGADRRPS